VANEPRDLVELLISLTKRLDAEWPKPTGLEPEKNGIPLPALMLAMGRSEEEVNRLERSGGDAA
jgi:hypothetical protein